MRSIRAGKHVLVEKPSTNTSFEAEILFNLPELKGPDAPVLLEAFHNRFHPAVHKFLSYVSPADVVHAHTDCMVPAWMTGKDDIAFNYAMGGGSMMMMGTYSFGILRMIFGPNNEPEECTSCETQLFNDGVHDQCDTQSKATFRWPNGAVGEAEASLRGPAMWKPSEARVTHREVAVPDKTLPAGQEKYRTRIVTLHGFVHAVAWHRVDVTDSYVIREAKEGGNVVRQWTESSSHKAYSYEEAGMPGVGEKWWMSYRYQLEEFVNKVKGRQTQYWVTGEDSINQMKMLDMAYLKSGLGLRPQSTYR